RRHHVVRPLQLVMLGLSGLWAGMLIESLHHSFALHAAVMTASGSLVALAHYFNLKFNGLYAVSAVRTTTKQ
ncbi:MAG TPA: hypothetical protein PK135_13665, partial [Arenimonas sp.]|nr:hypothetical protein [Arenimonas sp.]